MDITASISRLADFWARNGIKATFLRVGLAVRRTLFSSRMAVFYCDLAGQATLPAILPDSLKVERKRSPAELSPVDLQEMTSFWNPKQTRRNIAERFEKGASVWIIKSEDKLAGYGWTLQGRTIEPHYFPFGLQDVHLFDFHIFSPYRGQGLNPLLVTHMLRSLAGECGGHAFIEAAMWNEAQLSSLQKTPFRRLGWARKLTIGGRTLVFWSKPDAVPRAPK